MASSLVRLSDRELMDVILPSLPTRDLLNLCQCNRHLYRLCSDDNLWRHKVLKDYPQRLLRPEGLTTWFAYYIYLTRHWQIPVFIDSHLARMVTISEDPNTLQQIVADFYLEITPKNPNRFMIAFVDTGFHPIIVYKWPSLQEYSYDDDWSKIAKIVVMRHDYIRIKEDPNQINPYDIYLETISDEEEVHGIITLDGKLLDAIDLGDIKENSLYNMLATVTALNLHPIEEIPIVPVEEMANFLRSHGIEPYTQWYPLSADKIRSYYEWMISGASQQDMHKLIYTHLKTRGYLHHLTGPVEEISFD